MTKIKYCKRCIMPSTRPRITFDEEGICNACKNWETKKDIDWELRKEKLKKIYGEGKIRLLAKK